MHFHLPKPLHGWREFAGEVGIIVIGVLIALGAEQVLEDWHWRHQLGLERSALRDEVRSNLNAVANRMALEPCVRSRLSELQQVVAAGPRGVALHLKGPVGLPLPQEGAKGAWSIALSGQALSHMPVEEQLAYSNAFSNYENWDLIRGEERQAWIRLDVLDQAVPLSDADWAGVRQGLSQALAADARIRAVGPFIVEDASAGEKPKAMTAKEVFQMQGYGQDICRPILPRG